MLGTTLRISLIVAIIIYFVIILWLLKEKKLSLKYTLLWILAGVVMAVLVVFPKILTWLSRLVGIQSSMNGLFIFCIAFIIMILMSLTSIVTRLNRKVRVLTQELAILEKRIRELEKQGEAPEEKA